MGGGEASGTDAALLGYALAFRNASLGIDLFGSPKELMDEIRDRELDLAVIVDADETTIESRDVFKRRPEISMSGGIHAEAILDIVAAIDARDAKAAARAIARDPAAVLPGHSGAEVPLLIAASSSATEILRMLITAGARSDTQGQFGMTALHWAAAKGSRDAVTALLKAGADPRRVSWFYLTPGELALLNGQQEVARDLGDHGSVAMSAAQVLQRMGEWSRTSRRLRD